MSTRSANTRQRAGNAVCHASRLLSSATHGRFAIRLAWDGTDFHGFQSQQNERTIQDVIEHRLERLLQRPIRVLAWGRTDAGVHGSGAVITVDLTHAEIRRLSRQRGERGVDTGDDLAAVAKTLLSTLQSFCPHQAIVATACQTIPSTYSFDPRYSCKWKRYVYSLLLLPSASALSPFERYAWQVTPPRHETDFWWKVESMQEACSLLSSASHSYEWLSVVQEGEERDMLRTVQVSMSMVGDDQQPYPTATTPTCPSHKGAPLRIRIALVSDFFLYRMVRRIVGVLVAIGKGQVSVTAFQTCLEQWDQYYYLHQQDQDSDSKCDDANATMIPSGSAATTARVDEGKDSTRFSKGGIPPKACARPSLPSELVQTAPPHGLCLEHIDYGSEAMLGFRLFEDT